MTQNNQSLLAERNDFMNTQFGEKKQKICIVGGGLAGPMLAIMMARQGYKVKIIEGRSDMRKLSHKAGRSINLTLTNRGFSALEQVGLKEQLLRMSVPMIGRMIHDIDGSETLTRYGTNDSQAIHSVSRGELNCELLRLADETEGIELHFDTSLTNYELKSNILHFKNRQTNAQFELKDHLVIAADGVNSLVRAAMMKETRLNFSQTYESYGYKELTLPSGPNGTWQLEKKACHIWARGGFMMTGLPNSDGNYTCTLFLSYKDGKENFELMKTDEQIKNFFIAYFPDVYKLIPDLVEQFQRNPIGDLCTIKVEPWNYKDHAILIGDAAHSLVPFYGQGMNCALEDCVVFSAMMDRYKDRDLTQEEWTDLLDQFAKSRKPNSDAIQDMALENFIELRDSVNDKFFKLKKACELKVAEKYSDFRTKYSLVCFSTSSYSTARQRGIVHDDVLSDLCKDCDNAEEFDEDKAYVTIQKRYLELTV